VLNKRGKKLYCMRSANNNKSIDIKFSVDDVPPEYKLKNTTKESKVVTDFIMYHCQPLIEAR
jgi:hypothetical protein